MNICCTMTHPAMILWEYLKDASLDIWIGFYFDNEMVSFHPAQFKRSVNFEVQSTTTGHKFPVYCCNVQL